MVHGRHHAASRSAAVEASTLRATPAAVSVASRSAQAGWPAWTGESAAHGIDNPDRRALAQSTALYSRGAARERMPTSPSANRLDLANRHRRSLRLEREDDKTFRYAWQRREHRTDRDVLELRHDARRTRLASVVQEVIAVPARTTPGPHLNKPRPRRTRRTGDGDGVRQCADGVRKAARRQVNGALVRSEWREQPRTRDPQ